MTMRLLQNALNTFRDPGPKPASTSGSTRVYLLLETGGGGSGRHVLDLYAGLVAAGWDVHLLLSTTRMDAAFAMEVTALPQHHITYLQLRRSPHVSDVAQIRRIRRHLKLGDGPVILHAHSTKAAMLACALRGRSMCRVFTPHAYRGMDPRLVGYRAKVVRAAERVFSRPFARIIAVSPDEVGYAAALGVARRRIHLIPNGVDAASIRSVAGADRRQGNGYVLGFLGRLVEQKNPELFLRVLGELVQRGEDVHAIVVGDGPLLPQLKQLASELQLSTRIQWLGTVPALPHLTAMDALVHTSAYESLPYALLEAVAANVPVVSVDNAGSRAIFGELLPQAIVPEGTAHALANAVAALLQDRSVRQQYDESYHEIMERFSTRTMVNQTIAVYQGALLAMQQPKAPLLTGWLPRLAESLHFHLPLRRVPRLEVPELDDLVSISRTQ